MSYSVRRFWLGVALVFGGATFGAIGVALAVLAGGCR